MLHTAQFMIRPFLLCANDDATEAGVDNLRTETLEFGNELKRRQADEDEKSSDI